MARYGLLILPATNRVYAESSIALTRAELEVFSRSVLGGRPGAIDTATVGGARYVTFEADRLDARDAALLSNLSSIYALFEFVPGPGDAGDIAERPLLRPVDLCPLDRFDDDLITIPKYPGKTNEQFTKLLLNVTLLASAFAPEMLQRRFHVLDPLCGRGTTLNQAMMYGFDAAGVDLDQKDFEAYTTFLSTWLKRKRLKHQLDVGPVRRNRQVVARRLHVTLASSKESYRAGETQRIDVVNADTVRAGEFFRPGTVDLVVTDAPYGVQHGSRSAARGLARGPLDLLAEAVPVWAGLLRPGGALGIAWNTYVAHRDEIVKIVAQAGLAPLNERPWLAFRHRVDQSIVRDLLVARRT